MDNQLKLCLPLSLKELVLRKVALLFCSNSNVLKFFYQSLFYRLDTCEVKEWLEASEKKLKLGLPKSLNKQVIDRIQAIGFEIRRWKEINRCGSEAEIELPDVSKLCWTSTRAIDYRKIAAQYVMCDRLALDWRYKTACRNCLENHIPLLWHELSEGAKKKYKIDGRMLKLECCWSYPLRGKQFKLEHLWRESDRNLTSFDQLAFEESAEHGNQVAAEYFFQTLTPEEREASLMKTAYNVTDGYVLFYLLSVMNPDQQMEIVKARPVEILLCFLDWPRRHLLPENAGIIWAHLPQSDYGNLLIRIYTIQRQEGKGFSKFFQEFFKHAPQDFIKNSFVAHVSDHPACRVLGALVDSEDSESVEVMLRRADAASRAKLLLSDGVVFRFYYCILRDRWDVVEVCLREAALSEADRGALKKSVMRFLDLSDSEARKFRRFYELLDETGASDDEERKAKRRKLEHMNSAVLGNKIFF